MTVIRLLHISDLHFGPPHREVMDEAVRLLVESEKPDALLVSGDITQRARPAQFQAARRFLDSISVPKVVVPGNHDVPLWALPERLLRPMGRWKRWFSDETEPTLQLPGVWVYGINTAKGLTLKNGTYRASSLERMAVFFRQSPPGVLRVVVAHHHLVPAPSPWYDPVAGRATAAARALADARVDLLVAGHLHHGFLHPLGGEQPTPAAPTIVLHSGTTMSTRGRHAERDLNSLNRITVDDEAIRVEQLHHSPDARREGGGAFEVQRRITLPRMTSHRRDSSL